MSDFHPLEVVRRGSDTQLQVGKKNCIIVWGSKLCVAVATYNFKRVNKQNYIIVWGTKG